jgi:phosphonate transport system permease protein
MVLTYAIIAVLIVAATFAARGSARRLVVAGALGALLVYFVQPLAQLTGAYSRHAIAPTPFGFSFQYPLFWLVPIVTLVVLWLAFTNRSGGAREQGLAGVAAGVTILGVLLGFSTSSQSIVQVVSVPWVLEALIPLGALGLGLLLSRSSLPASRRAVGYGASVVAALGLGVYFFSSAAPETFDALRGYYRVTAAPTQDQLNLVVEDWRKDLEFNNGVLNGLNEEWKNANQVIADAETALGNARQGVRNSLSIGGDALEFARNAEREAERTLRDAYQKRAQLQRQRAGYGVTDSSANLQPLQAISSAAELPRGFSVGRDAGEAGVRRVFPTRQTYGFGTLTLFGILMLLGGATLLFRGDAALETRDVPTGALLAVIAATLAFGFNAVEFDLGRFIAGFPFIQDFGRRSWPPDFAGILSDGMKALAITVATAMIGTTLAALLALPSSFLAARNLTQKSWWGRTVYPLMRIFYNVDRGVDTLILALVFVAAVGLGPLAGVLAMGIHSMADLGKLYSEAIENAEKGPIEALEASGAPGVSVIRWAVLPQVLPLFVSYTLYRFEINFRVSIILGFVGAGGVGFLIQETMRSGKYAQMIILVALVVIMVNILDFISATVRRRLVG